MCDDFTLQKYTRFPNPPNDTIEAAIDPPHSTTQTESSVGNCPRQTSPFFIHFLARKWRDVARCGEETPFFCVCMLVRGTMVFRLIIVIMLIVSILLKVNEKLTKNIGIFFRKLFVNYVAIGL